MRIASMMLMRTPRTTTTYCMTDLMEQLNHIHHYTYQLLKVASSRMKACYEHLANCGIPGRKLSVVVTPTSSQREIA
jgi:hypothetical protein